MSCGCNKNRGRRKQASPGLRRVSAAVNPLLRSPAATAGLNAIAPAATPTPGPAFAPAPAVAAARQRINNIRAMAIRKQFGR